MPIGEDAAHIHIRGDQADMPVARKHAEGRAWDPLRHESRLRNRGHEVVFFSGQKQSWALNFVQPLPYIVSSQDSQPVSVACAGRAGGQFQELLEFLTMGVARVHEE